MKLKIFLSLAIVCLIMLVIYSCSKSGGYATTPPPSGGNTATINVYGMAFPASTTVAKGTTVTWNNQDGFAHTVTSDDGTSFNGNLSAGSTFSFVANTAGTFTYHCNIHSNMHGTLIVTPQ